MTPIAATMPSSRMMGTAMATEPEMNSPALRAMPSLTISREVVAQLPDVGRRERQAGGPADDLVEDLGRRVGEQHAGERAPGRAGRCGRRRGSRAARWRIGISCRQTAERPMRRLMTAVSPVSSASSREERVGDADQLLAAHVGAGPDEQPRPEP